MLLRTFIMLSIVVILIISQFYADAHKQQKSDALQLLQSLLQIIRNYVKGLLRKLRWWSNLIHRIHQQIC